MVHILKIHKLVNTYVSDGSTDRIKDISLKCEPTLYCEDLRSLISSVVPFLGCPVDISSTRQKEIIIKTHIKNRETSTYVMMSNFVTGWQLSQVAFL